MLIALGAGPSICQLIFSSEPPTCVGHPVRGRARVGPQRTSLGLGTGSLLFFSPIVIKSVDFCFGLTEGHVCVPAGRAGVYPSCPQGSRSHTSDPDT